MALATNEYEEALDQLNDTQIDQFTQNSQEWYICIKLVLFNDHIRIYKQKSVSSAIVILSLKNLTWTSGPPGPYGPHILEKEEFVCHTIRLMLVRIQLLLAPWCYKNFGLFF